MARYQTVVTTMTCDMCPDETEATAAFTVALDEGNRARSLPRLVDVCEDHATQLRDLAAIVRRASVTARDAQPPLPMSGEGNVWACPLCGKEVSRVNATSHFTHGAHHVPRISQPPECPDCGKVVDNQAGMVNHRIIHGYDLLGDYVAAAQKLKRRKAR